LIRTWALVPSPTLPHPYGIIAICRTIRPNKSVRAEREFVRLGFGSSPVPFVRRADARNPVTSNTGRRFGACSSRTPAPRCLRLPFRQKAASQSIRACGRDLLQCALLGSRKCSKQREAPRQLGEGRKLGANVAEIAAALRRARPPSGLPSYETFAESQPY
jgi:hypothetical protein